MKTNKTVSIDTEVALAAKKQGLNISRLCEGALRARLELPDSGEIRQARKKNPDRLYVPGIGFVDKNSKQ